MARAASLVGVAGGAGTTRLAVETAAALAAAGRDAAVLDLDLATQGLARYVEGRIDRDAASLLAEDADPLDAVHEIGDAPGRCRLLPAHAPFARIAAAKAPDAARRVEDVLEALAAEYDAVLVDTPPVADNPSVAAVTASDAVAFVVPPTRRGIDGLQRERGRVLDVGATPGPVVATSTTPEDAPPDADHTVPAGDPDAEAVPAAFRDPRGPLAVAAGELAESLFDLDLDLDPAPRGLVGTARRHLG